MNRKRILLIGINTPNIIFNSGKEAAHFLGLTYSEFILASARLSCSIKGSDGYFYYIDELLEEKSNERTTNSKK